MPGWKSAPPSHRSTGFNNCTARTTGGLTRQFFGRGRHHIEDCYPTDVVAQFKKLQQQKAWQ